MEIIHIAGLAFGAGAPKICVPLTGADLPALEGELAAAGELPADLYEWRADHFAGDPSAALELLRDRAVRPVLCTLRTKAQGGERALSPGEYEEAVRAFFALPGAFQLVDVELACGAERVRRLGELARSRGVGVVVSHHDFSATPDRAGMLALLGEMKSLGADLPKLAVTPTCPADVLALLEATLQAHEALGPVITMSMGSLGRVSRVCGELTGSCLTFAAGTRASAPGQIGARAMEAMLDNLRLCQWEGEGQAHEK